MPLEILSIHGTYVTSFYDSCHPKWLILANSDNKQSGMNLVTVRNLATNEYNIPSVIRNGCCVWMLLWLYCIISVVNLYYQMIWIYIAYIQNLRRILYNVVSNKP